MASNLASGAKLQKSEQTELVPPSFFIKLPRPGLSTVLTSALSALPIGTPALEEKRPTFAFLRRIHEHQKLAPSALGGSSMDDRYTAVLANAGDTLVALVSGWADQWMEGTRSDADVEKRPEGMVEEVAWQCHLLSFEPYIVLIPSSAHLVTSAIFLLTLVLPSEDLLYPPAPLARRLTLLKAYLAMCVGWYISRGNDPVPIKEFYSSTHDRLTAPPAKPAPPSASRKPLSAPGGPWERTIANAIAHPDEHIAKAVRSFAAFSTRWGGRPVGYFSGGGEDGLEGREVLDGTLFVRAASLTLDRLGWAHESGISAAGIAVVFPRRVMMGCLIAPEVEVETRRRSEEV
ncbi:hypothetical protein BJV78DRAFT_1364185 [Lactifluus subvellereus]|nr:hypothetical protein BJV78DRAFT_1364185 [Lactifluus subvellereus]